MTKNKRRHAPYPAQLPDDSRRRFPQPETQTHGQARIHPPVLIDDREAAQEREIETLLLDNHRLASAHVALKQDLDAVQQELRHLSSTAATVKAERDAEVREIYEKARRMEGEVHTVDELSVEMARVRTDIQNLNADRKELTAKLQEMEDDLVKVRSELQQFPVIKAEIESMRKEVQRGRAAIDYEKKMHASNLEYNQAMEKHKITMTAEIESLHAELANAEKRARAAAAAAAAAAPSNSNHQFAAANPSFTYSANYGNPETGYGGTLYPAPYAVHQVQVSADATQYGQGAMSYGSHGPYDMTQPYLHQ
ncbi:PREDICTED: protein FLC EXPRESSOR-like isoform X1 [Nicotiana attenuata]|uniref:Protein flx-like 1 n=1 Tax=Nicotiana attenuata TaxID=49451 RepID=A0A1J6IPN9_NICAT|nr:PREDICTED: protein FLC EXPRESSOR-like isoform X1 [Nicotiana attenuata]OIT00811.1 protein flx-like 1 [Nicotiana attenuata]